MDIVSLAVIGLFAPPMRWSDTVQNEFGLQTVLQSEYFSNFNQ